MATPYLYLIHFERPYHHARHYLGLTHDVAGRIAEHINGGGARLMAVIEAAGVKWELAAVGRGTRLVERRLKLNKYARRICPVCRADNGKAWKAAVRHAKRHPAPRNWWQKAVALNA